MKNIQQLSSEVGIGVDTLRIWERRYGFPAPQRDRRGHRSYSQNEVEELRIVKKLQDLGQRPGVIFALNPNQRRKLVEKLVEEQAPKSASLKYLAAQMPVVEIGPQLRLLLSTHGLSDFIHETVVPLVLLLGLGWTDGSISIAREHFISDLLEDIIKNEIKKPPADATASILCSTLNGERHRLGLLMAAAIFHQQGIGCQLISDDLPISEIAQLAEQLQVDAVALSFSPHFPATQAKKDLVSLRNILDPQIKLVAGGQALDHAPYLAGVRICTDLKQIPALCQKEFGVRIIKEQ
ncbi:MerR family transcriptional regulator [Geopsychrobacter electrodiphilus]|uniref:MerR family transcriptional regulator n=1 Tax=Geopsychrobacter electrodiphilus TaxID=225196 RepID=UPI00037FC8CA|nr:MerR family transcriptional regulator [Geopsychrobacter electrodiphilus]